MSRFRPPFFTRFDPSCLNPHLFHSTHQHTTHTASAYRLVGNSDDVDKHGIPVCGATSASMKMSQPLGECLIPFPIHLFAASFSNLLTKPKAVLYQTWYYFHACQFILMGAYSCFSFVGRWLAFSPGLAGVWSVFIVGRTAVCCRRLPLCRLETNGVLLL